ncbi:MAG TPA: VWA domain-containing protein [Blastocatellia bacterium]|nr:VWA domain-containing protein [Blastocatellia bacterium]
MSSQKNDPTLVRWRLILGHYAADRLQVGMDGREQRMERALDFLYSREYGGRGVREPNNDREGSLDPSQLQVPNWLAEVRDLFPKETIEVIEKHALDRYGMTELITDKETLRKMEPNFDLLKMILQFRGQMKGEVLEEARRIVRRVVEEIKEKLATDIRRKMAGKLNRFSRSPQKIAQNFDWRGTIKRNLKNYDAERKTLVLDELRFFSRIERRLPWTIILCIDESGSMLGSVIYSAVMAGILAGLPLINVKLVIFDTSVVDLTEYVEDPVEVLMNVQLGGGTDIGQAMTYCEGLVDTPVRTILVLVSDFYEGGAPSKLLASCRRLREAGVRLIGLGALDEEATASYDRKMAEALAENGMDIAALTPGKLADWLARVIS